MTSTSVQDDVEMVDLNGRISMKYTLSTGPAAGQFLAELTNRRLVGSRCSGCGRIMVPAQDFCGTCHSASASDLVAMPETGTITAITRTSRGTVVLVRIDGAGTDMLHNLVEGSGDGLDIGDRVSVVWASQATGAISDIAGFEATDQPAGQVGALTSPLDPITEKPDAIDLKYKHSYGPYYGRLFDEIRGNRRIVGSKCSSCEAVLLPPREWCDLCHVRTMTWSEVADTGILKAFSVIRLEFVGQLREPPYVYAEIVLDGADTKIIHMLGGVDPDEAAAKLKLGAKVRAVWKDQSEANGTLADIEHFELAETE